MACSIIELPSCIVQSFIDKVLWLLNLSLLPFLDSIRYLLTNPPKIDIFAPLWGTFVYVISIFYGLFIIWAGLNFVVGSYSPEKREQAKLWLQNAILMILFVQASFLIYSLIAQIASGLAAGTFNLIDPNFFKFNLDNASNVAIEIFYGASYAVVLLLTLILLALNFIFASIGVVFFPFGVFFYFIPPLRDIGRLILSVLAYVMFIPFVACIILLGGAEIVKSVASDVRMAIATASFLLLDISMILLAFHAIVRSVMGLLRTDIARGVMFVKGQFLLGAAMAKPRYDPMKDPNSREYNSQVHKDYPRYEK